MGRAVLVKKIPTWIEVDLDQLRRNLASIRRRLDDHVKILLTVKADAYGHGAVQVAEAASKQVDMFGVATLDEAIELKEARIRNKILILSPILATEVPAVVYSGLAVTISSGGIATELSRYAVEHDKYIEVHVEVDTGMGRTGVSVEDAPGEIARIAALPNLKLEGVYTHFPVSDSDPDFTRQQIATFNSLIARLRAAGVTIPLIHSANSAAIPELEEAHMDLVRPGLLAYGSLPGGLDPGPDFVPILSWKSRIARVRRVPKGRTISYGRTFETARDSVIGVIPVGYGHGYPYQLSGRGQMLIGGVRVPIVGRVTMDMTMVDLTDLPRTPPLGEEVVLIGTQRRLDGSVATITMHELANWANTIGYEIICGLSKRVPRTYFRKGKVETYKSLLGILPNHVAV
jgi:alanine racemase